MLITGNLVTHWKSVEVVSLATGMMCAACSARQLAPAGLLALSLAMFIMFVQYTYSSACFFESSFATCLK